MMYVMDLDDTTIFLADIIRLDIILEWLTSNKYCL